LLNLNKKPRKQIGIRNGLKIFSKLQVKKIPKNKTQIKQVSERQKIINREWSKVVQQKCKDLNYICQWCGKEGLPSKSGIHRNCLTGHHIIKRRFGIHTYENAFICHWRCHDFIETHNIKVEIYPTKSAWENKEKGESKDEN
jgi:hypothetical protein